MASSPYRGFASIGVGFRVLGFGFWVFWVFRVFRVLRFVGFIGFRVPIIWSLQKLLLVVQKAVPLLWERPHMESHHPKP